MVRESKRNNPAYRKHTFAHLGDFVEILASIDLYEQVHAIVTPVIEEILEGSENMDVDSKRDGDPSTKTLCVRTKSWNLPRTIRKLIRFFMLDRRTSWRTQCARYSDLSTQVVGKILHVGSFLFLNNASHADPTMNRPREQSFAMSRPHQEGAG